MIYGQWMKSTFSNRVHVAGCGFRLKKNLRLFCKSLQEKALDILEQSVFVTENLFLTEKNRCSMQKQHGAFLKKRKRKGCPI